VNALLLSLNVFLILTAYYVLKPVREALILGQGSPELKSYMSAGQVLLLAFVVPLYGRLAGGLPRRRLINIVTAFFAACLVLFYFLARAGVPLGIAFFLWIGIFNVVLGSKGKMPKRPLMFSSRLPSTFQPSVNCSRSPLCCLVGGSLAPRCP
jgi:hypothetical protein